MNLITKTKYFFKWLNQKDQEFQINALKIDKNIEAHEDLALAVGKWALFKAVNLPEFIIGLDTDAEAILDQYAIKNVSDARIEALGSRHLALVEFKISLCQELVDNGLGIYKFFRMNNIYVPPKKK